MMKKARLSSLKKLASMTRNNKQKDLYVMGDFNCVENNIERNPPTQR